MDASRPDSGIPVTGRDLRAASTPCWPASRTERAATQHRLQHQMEAGNEPEYFGHVKKSGRRRRGLSVCVVWLRWTLRPASTCPAPDAISSCVALRFFLGLFFGFDFCTDRAAEPPAPDDVMKRRQCRQAAAPSRSFPTRRRPRGAISSQDGDSQQQCAAGQNDRDRRFRALSSRR